MEQPTNEAIMPDPAVDQTCQVCREQPSKYTCPRCSMRTCSVGCVKRHKEENDCSGERSKTHFVKRNDYNYTNMMSDYVYLEDVARRSDTLTRERLRADRREPKQVELRSRALTKQVRATGINYSQLPSGMTRHKMNKTNYSSNFHQIFWTMECYFSRNGNVQRILEHSVPSNKSPRALFNNLLFAESPQGKGSYPVIRYQAREFVNTGIDQFVVALKKPEGPKDTYVDLTPHLDRTWKELLRGERIIEFPSLYIWLKGDVGDNDKLEDKIFVEAPPPRPKGSRQKNRDGDNNASEPVSDEQQVATTTDSDQMIPSVDAATAGDETSLQTDNQYQRDMVPAVDQSKPLHDDTETTRLQQNENEPSFVASNPSAEEDVQ